MSKKTQSKRILVLSNQRVLRETIAQALGKFGFHCHFCGNFDLVTQILQQHHCGSILHDWGGFDHKQSVAFQSKISKLEDFSRIPRLILVDEINTQIMSVAVDYGVRRIVTRQHVGSGLSGEVAMVLRAEAEVSELLAKVRQISQGINSRNFANSQQQIDKLVEDAFVTFPNDQLVRLEFANLKLRQGDLALARSLAEDLISDSPGNVRAMNLLSKILLKENKFEESSEVLERANILSPYNVERLVMLGEIFFALDKPEKALMYFNNALEMDPNSKEAKGGLGKAALTREDFEGAMHLFQDAFTESEIAGYFNNAAIIQVQKGEFEKAIRLYHSASSALKSPKIRSIVYYNLGLAFKKKGDHQKALEAFDTSLKFDPTNEKSLLNRKSLSVKAS